MEDLKNAIAEFLETADSPDTRDTAKLKEIYEAVTGEKGKCKSPVCVAKMLTAVRKAYYSMTGEAEPLPVRKYTLKPGNHSFAGGGPAVHNNENTTDDHIEWYLNNGHDHIKKLLIN